MFSKIMFAMILLPGEEPVLYTNPKQTRYPDTGYEPDLIDYYKPKYLGRDVMFDRVQANDRQVSWELWCDDEFLHKQLPYNELATTLARLRYPDEYKDEVYIAGPVVAFFRCDPREKFPNLFPWDQIEVQEHEA